MGKSSGYFSNYDKSEQLPTASLKFDYVKVKSLYDESVETLKKK